MGREWNGVEIPKGLEVRTDGGRAPTLGLRFTYKRIQCREGSWQADTPAQTKIAAASALAKLTTIRNEIASGVFKYGNHFPDSPKCKLFGGAFKEGHILFGKILTEWMSVAEAKMEASGFDCYRKSINGAIRPKWDNIPVEAITTHALEDWVREEFIKKRKIVLSSTRNHLIPMRKALAWAKPRYGLAVNPFADFDLEDMYPRRLLASDYDPDPFTDQERETIIATAHRIKKPLLAWLAQFWFWSGLRPQEIIALQWPDIDFIGETFRVCRINSMGDLLERTKTESGKRTVKILPPAMRALAAMKPLTFLRPDQFVFVNPTNNEPWSKPDQISDTQWRTLLKIAGVRYRPANQCRHTFGSMMARNGEDMAWLQTTMGHKTMAITQRFYIRFIGNDAEPGRYKTKLDYSKAA